MKFSLPHTFVLLFGLIVVAAALTYVIPAGEYARTTVEGRSVVNPDAFSELSSNPATLGDVLLAYPRGLLETSLIVFFIFIIGGAFGVVEATGAIDAGIGALVRACGGRGEIVIPVLMASFAFGGGSIGMLEELLPFLPALVALSRRLGYDAIVGGAIGLVGSGAGFAAAFFNPFTVGVAQGIAGVPLFSGLSYRLVCWLVITSIAVGYVTVYARRHRRPVASDDAVTSVARATRRQTLVLASLGASLVAVVVGALRFQWGILELSALFVALAIVAGLAGGLGANETAEKFIEGAAGIATGALVVGLARGVLVIFDGAQVTDTILHALATGVASLPSELTVLGMYATQIALNFIVPSGSGQAALSIPILAPLGDLVGVTRQTTVLVYQFGDGFTNVFTPTQGYFMAGLAIINVRWVDWVRFIWPLQLMWLGAGAAMLLIAHWIRLGPF